jgi:3-methyl-2-oxobutanoate hydroxymethyltransferase
MKAERVRIVSVTAYDYPSARLADEAGVDLLLVGDSVGMVVLGYESTIPVTLSEMAHHLKAVVRAQPRALVVADLPFLSFQTSPEDAVRSSGRLMKRGAEAVKLEGGRRVLPQIQAILAADIPVLGHLGLTPQSVHRFGGYRVQGRDRNAADLLREDAIALERAGCFAIVLEGVPLELGREITQALQIPTIGIGAGVHCDGQVLVLHDLIGLTFGKPARFVRRYAETGETIRNAIAAFREDVRAGRYPTEQESYAQSPERPETKPCGS